MNLEKPERTIKDLQLIFLELPKFQTSTILEKKLQVLWLRFMSELNQDTRTVPEEWLSVPEIKEAVGIEEKRPIHRENYRLMIIPGAMWSVYEKTRINGFLSTRQD